MRKVNGNSWFWYGMITLILFIAGIQLGYYAAKHEYQSLVETQSEVIIRFQSSFEDTKGLVDRLANAMVVFEADMLDLEWKRNGEAYSHVRFEEEK